MADLPESTQTTFEQARMCPKCKHYGTLLGSVPGPRGSKVETYKCETEVCPWYNTSWIVQINQDGSIPNRTEGPKEFPVLPDSQRQAYEDYLARLAAEDKGGH